MKRELNDWMEEVKRLSDVGRERVYRFIDQQKTNRGK